MARESGEVVHEYRLLRPLGRRAVPAFIALDRRGTFVVTELLDRSLAIPPEETKRFTTDARRLMRLVHPNVARVRAVAGSDEDAVLVSELVEGTWYASLLDAAKTRGKQLPLVANLRILVDMLQGLSALHELRDAKRVALRLVHGEMSPDNIVVGLDGGARIAHTCRVHLPGAAPRAAAVGYLAPEVLLGDHGFDARADVFSAGVMLWEALAGKRMHEGESSSAIVMRLLGGKIDKPVMQPGAEWAEGLTDVAMRAIAADPAARFQTAAELTGELRRAAGAKLATKTSMASLVEALCGDEIRARRSALAEVTGTNERVTVPGPAPSMQKPSTPVEAAPLEEPLEVPLEEDVDYEPVSSDALPEALRPPSAMMRAAAKAPPLPIKSIPMPPTPIVPMVVMPPPVPAPPAIEPPPEPDAPSRPALTSIPTPLIAYEPKAVDTDAVALLGQRHASGFSRLKKRHAMVAAASLLVVALAIALLTRGGESVAPIVAAQTPTEPMREGHTLVETESKKREAREAPVAPAPPSANTPPPNTTRPPVLQAAPPRAKKPRYDPQGI